MALCVVTGTVSSELWLQLRRVVMKVTNNTSASLIAFGWHLVLGYGEDLLINPGETKEVLGPFLGETDDLKCYVALPGDIVCQEKVDDMHGFQVGVGQQLNLKNGGVGVTVRHYSEQRIIAPDT